MARGTKAPTEEMSGDGATTEQQTVARAALPDRDELQAMARGATDKAKDVADQVGDTVGDGLTTAIGARDELFEKVKDASPDAAVAAAAAAAGKARQNPVPFVIALAALAVLLGILARRTRHGS